MFGQTYLIQTLMTHKLNFLTANRNNDCCIFVCVIKFHYHNTTVAAIYHVFKIKNIKICVIYDSMNIVSIFLVCIKNIWQSKIQKYFSSEIDFSILQITVTLISQNLCYLCLDYHFTVKFSPCYHYLYSIVCCDTIPY